jgi:hypothetical protein
MKNSKRNKGAAKNEVVVKVKVRVKVPNCQKN